jgi:hypothetical protein
MTDNQRIPWKRLYIEAAAIVASILLAFAIDAWWADRLEHREKVIVLDLLSAEFETNYTRLGRSDCRVQCRVGQAADRLYLEIVDALADGAETIEAEDEALLQLLSTPTFEVETPVLDGLVRSGRIQLIDDQEILSAIALWDRTVRSSAELEARARTNVDSRLIPTLVDRGDIGHIIRSNMLKFMIDDFSLAGTTTLRLDTKLKAAIAERYENATRADRSLTQIKETTDGVLIAIGKTE